ncbi:MAG: ABC transporter ATP-binding protein [Actinomycetota bacterium]
MSSDGLEVDSVTLAHGPVVAVDEASLRIGRGRIVALLGPSGCGKSTLLRGIAGLHEPRSGRVRWRGEDITSVPTHRRSVGLMFQDHALFPHRNVRDNVAFGLRMAGVAAGERVRRAEELLDLVGLPAMGGRTIGTLSGGQAQRVALARALAPQPDLLLLDEPLGSLDRALRDRLVLEIRSIVGQLGTTTIHVTHDHDEAITVADDLALMNDGRITAFGSVGALLDDPGDVATAAALRLETLWRLPVEGGRAQTPFGPIDADGPTANVLLRPTHVQVSAEGVEARVTEAHFRGDAWHLTCAIADTTVVARHGERIPAGATVRLRADLVEAALLDD